MKEAISKLLEGLMGALGGWLAGVFISVWTAGSIQSLFDYQTGWYLAYAPYLLVPIFVFLAYIFLIGDKWWLGILLILLTLVVYIATHNVIPIESYYRFVEFVALWTLVAQTAAICGLGAWQVFWQRYAFVRQTP
jgi:hypothetical protein